MMETAAAENLSAYISSGHRWMKAGVDDQISCLVIFKEQDTGTVKKLFEAFDILSAPGKLFAGPYIVYYICFYDPICIGGLYVPAFKG